MTLKLTQLKRSGAGDSPTAFYQDGELGLFASYKRHLQIAELLGGIDHQLYRDSWLSLLASIECFLKDVYCIARYQVWKDKSPSTLPHREFYERKRISEVVVAKSFAHNLKELAKYLQALCPDLDSDNPYQNFVLNLPDNDWTIDRYSNPVDRTFKVRYETLFRSFKSLLDHSFGEWK